MTNPTKRDSAAKKVVAVARSIVTYQIGLPTGCRRMTRTLYWLAPYEENLPTIYHQYLDNARDFPLGSERLNWNREALRRKDVELERINQEFRDQIFDASWRLIDRFSDLSHSDIQPME